MFSRKWKVWRFVQMNRRNVLLDRLWRRGSGFKGKRVALLECRDLLCVLDSIGANHQQVRLEYRNAFRDKFH